MSSHVVNWFHSFLQKKHQLTKQTRCQKIIRKLAQPPPVMEAKSLQAKLRLGVFSLRWHFQPWTYRQGFEFGCRGCHVWESFGRRGGCVCGILRFFYNVFGGCWMLDIRWAVWLMFAWCLVLGLMLIDMLGYLLDWYIGMFAWLICWDVWCEFSVRNDSLNEIILHEKPKELYSARDVPRSFVQGFPSCVKGFFGFNRCISWLLLYYLKKES